MGIQQNVQLQYGLVFQILLHRKDVIFNHIALNDNDRQQLPCIHPGKLQKLQLAALGLGRGNQSCILGILGQNPGHLL